MLCAINHGQPDMVPVAPDISGMLPTRAAGLPFWDSYLYNNPPGGDCDLAEVKQKFGNKLSLMGNLSTTLVTMGTSADVREAARKAIDAAKEGGGFILSTGDECGPETPDDNIYAMVETARTYGRY